jgi:hypothetical protein
MSARIDKADLRLGYRIEVEALVMPLGEFGARLYTPRKTPAGRVKWEQRGPIMISGTPESAARDLLEAINQGLVEGVEIAA